MNMKPSTISLALAAVVALAVSLPSGAAADEGTTKARLQLERTLSAIEFVPSRQTLERIHPEVDRLLREIAAGKTTHVLAQNRAITTLRLFPGKETTALLQELVDKSKCKADDGLCRLNLQQALASFATIKGHAAVSRVAPFLAHAHMDVRMAAALALRLSRSPRALPLMAEQLTREKSDTVRAEIEQQIRIMEGAEERVPKPRMPGK